MTSGEIVSNELLQFDYFKVRFYAPEICRTARAGQFVHVRITDLRDRILRRPFSICDVGSDGRLTVIYKVVGEGTKKLATLKPGAVCELLGPLGVAFTPPSAGEVPVIVGGGYGSAAMYMLAKTAPEPGVVLLGARSKDDLLLIDEYRAAGFEVQLATNDGSAGRQGFVTALLPEVLRRFAGRSLRFYGCGPMPMLLALAKLLQEAGFEEGEISLDHLMCCGVGACFACVVKVRDGAGWRYARTCSEGPVFKVKDVYLEEC